VNVTLLKRSMMTARLNQVRPFSVAFNVKSKFEQAYEEKMESLGKIAKKVVEPKNKAEYGKQYYNKDRMANMKTGFVHPYHSEGSPMYMSNMYYMKTLFQAVGPE
jgi:hypothetical protein